jgi:hypothetical protein
MRLARALVAARRLILPEGKVLNSADVDLLIRRHPSVHAYVVDPILDESVQFDDDSRDKAVANYARRKFTSAVKQAQESLRTPASVAGMDVRAIEAAIVEIVQFLRDHPTAWAVVVGNEQGGSQLSEHAGNVFYLALVLGNAVRESVISARRKNKRYLLPPSARPAPALAPLGLAALFMDISLWQLHQEVGYEDPLTPQQRELVLEHPRASAEMLPESVDPLTHCAVLCHHENHDGSGYPRMLAGDDIHLYARLLRVADAYSAATRVQTQRQAKSTIRAMWEMVAGPYAAFYDPIILKVFQAVVQPYPIGAKVQLTCGRYAVVVRHGRRHGLLPEIIIAFDEDGKPLPRRSLVGPCSLDQHPELRIMSFAGEDLTDVYGDAPVYGAELPNPAAFHNLIESSFP